MIDMREMDIMRVESGITWVIRGSANMPLGEEGRY